MQKIRQGRYIKTIISDERTHTVFHEIDNLDTKSIDQAEDNYEKVFIVVRDFLEQQKDKQYNLVSETVRLSFAQDITDLLKQGGFIRKESE